ncbi:hypothetical protein GCM10027074_43490 [Streptomyces deserti]
MGVRDAAADVWLLLGPGLDQTRVCAELTEGFTHAFGDGCAVVGTGELLMRVHDGRLTLHRADGTAVRAPRVVYARLPTPTVSTDREVTLLRHLQFMGSALVNPIDAVLACVNKFWHLQELASAGLPVPDSVTYSDVPLGDAVGAHGFEPCVVKAVRGHRGRQVFLAPDRAMLRDVAGSLRADVPYLFQEYCAFSHGRDLRVIVVERAVWAQVRTATDGGLKSNVSLGGTITPCPGRHRDAEALAVRAAETVGLGVAGTCSSPRTAASWCAR